MLSEKFFLVFALNVPLILLPLPGMLWRAAEEYLKDPTQIQLVVGEKVKAENGRDYQTSFLLQQYLQVSRPFCASSGADFWEYDAKNW